MIRSLLAVLSAVFLMPILPGESDAGPGRPGDAISGGGGQDVIGGHVDAFGDRGGRNRTRIERRMKALIKDLSPDANQREDEGDKKDGGKTSKLGEGGSADAARKAELKRRGRAATLLTGSEGIRDKLGRSGGSSSGKSLG